MEAGLLIIQIGFYNKKLWLNYGLWDSKVWLQFFLVWELGEEVVEKEDSSSSLINQDKMQRKQRNKSKKIKNRKNRRQKRKRKKK